MSSYLDNHLFREELISIILIYFIHIQIHNINHYIVFIKLFIYFSDPNLLFIFYLPLYLFFYHHL
jgi:hypothetical protein